MPKLIYPSHLVQVRDIVFQHAINGFNSMPPKGTCMSCSAAVQYLINQTKLNDAGANLSKSTVPMQKPLTLNGGKHCL